MFNALRNVNVSRTLGYGKWKPDGNGAFFSWKEALLDVSTDTSLRRTHGWKQKLAQSPTEMKAFYATYQKMKSLISYCPEERHVIHSDLLHFNVLVENSNITGVLDWGCAKYGDFLYDIAWFIFWAPWFKAMDGINFKDKLGKSFPHLEERLACYQCHIALDSIVYSAFKDNISMVRQVLRRLESGTFD